jgi:hypothetical protein
MITLRILLARQISKRLERQARFHRRTLRDHQRREWTRIRNLETRSRGLRLYAAWKSRTVNVIRTQADDWGAVALASLSRAAESETSAAA